MSSLSLLQRENLQLHTENQKLRDEIESLKVGIAGIKEQLKDVVKRLSASIEPGQPSRDDWFDDVVKTENPGNEWFITK